MGVDKAKGEFFRHENVAKSDIVIYTHKGKEAIGETIEVRNGVEVPPRDFKKFSSIHF